MKRKFPFKQSSSEKEKKFKTTGRYNNNTKPKNSNDNPRKIIPLIHAINNTKKRYCILKFDRRVLNERLGYLSSEKIKPRKYQHYYLDMKEIGNPYIGKIKSCTKEMTCEEVKAKHSHDIECIKEKISKIDKLIEFQLYAIRFIKMINMFDENILYSILSNLDIEMGTILKSKLMPDFDIGVFDLKRNFSIETMQEIKIYKSLRCVLRVKLLDLDLILQSREKKNIIKQLSGIEIFKSTGDNGLFVYNKLKFPAKRLKDLMDLLIGCNIKILIMDLECFNNVVYYIRDKLKYLEHLIIHTIPDFPSHENEVNDKSRIDLSKFNKLKSLETYDHMLTNYKGNNNLKELKILEEDNLFDIIRLTVVEKITYGDRLTNLRDFLMKKFDFSKLNNLKKDRCLKYFFLKGNMNILYPMSKKTTHDIISVVASGKIKEFRIERSYLNNFKKITLTFINANKYREYDSSFGITKLKLDKPYYDVEIHAESNLDISLSELFTLTESMITFDWKKSSLCVSLNLSHPFSENKMPFFYMRKCKPMRKHLFINGVNLANP